MKDLTLSCLEVVTYDLWTDYLDGAARSVSGAWMVTGNRDTGEVTVRG